jgi:MFS family permease
MVRYLTIDLAWRSVSVCAIFLGMVTSSKPDIAASRCDDTPLSFSDAGSLVQLPLKDPIKTSAALNEYSLHMLPFRGDLSVGEVSSAVSTDAATELSYSKTAGMQAWLLLLGEGSAPKNHAWPTSDGAHRSWLGMSIQRHILMGCIMVCFVFMFVWTWTQIASRSCEQAHSDSLESEVRRRRSNSDIRPTVSTQSVEADPTSSRNVTFRSEDELLGTFAALPLKWRHACIFTCTMMSFAGAGAMNDTIGITFSSFEAEWGAQTPSRLACLSLVSTAGQIFSSIFAGEVADHRGRCFVARYASLLVVLCFWGSSLAPSLEMLAVARLLGGLGFGALNVAVPTLMSESVPKHAKCLLVLYQFGWPLGAATFAFIMSIADWRAANVAVLPAASMILAMFWCPGCIPESPKWLCSQGRLEDAADSVCRYGGMPPDTIDESLPVEISEELAPTGLQQKDPQQATTRESDSTDFYVHTALSMLCVASAAMLIKVWLPALLALRGVQSNHMAFVTMWMVEAGSLCVSGLLFGAPANSTRDDNLVLLRVSQVAFVIAAFAVMAYISVTSATLITLLGGVHLLGQANAANFLMAFATLSFPVAVRARCVAGIFLAQYAGCFIGPLLGSVLLQFVPKLGASGVLSVGSLIYSCGFLRTLSLSKLRPVH